MPGVAGSASLAGHLPPSGQAAPGPKGLPLVGSLFDFARDPIAFFESCVTQYGDFVAFRFGPQTSFLLNDPSEIERIFVKEHKVFPKAEHFWRQVRAVFGDGLLSSEGAFWQRQRRLAAPAFTPLALSHYARAIVLSSEQMLGTWQSGEVRDIHADMMGLTLKITAQALFGTQVDDDVAEVDAALDDVMEEIAARIKRPILIPDAVPLPGHIRYRRGLTRLNAIVERIISERRASPIETNDLLSHLIHARDEDGSEMSDRQLRDEVITFLLAGHETTALALSWSIYLLGQHPEIDEYAATEAQREAKQGAEPTDYIPRLHRCSHVITESMRLYPPAWGLSREAARDCEIGGYRVKAKTPIFTLPWILHRDARYFDEPLTFRPQRWEGGLAQRLPRFAYLPFGGGPRICIGNRFALMEATAVLATLLRRFRFVGQSDRAPKPFPSITLRPKGGVWVKLEARS